MIEKDNSSSLQWNFGLPIDLHSIGSQSEEYFKRMVEIKDKNIEDLLKQLRQTKEIYQQYKSQYLTEEKRMKSKIAQITTKLQVQTGELERYKQINAKLKLELETALERENRYSETHEKLIKQLKNTIGQLQVKNKELNFDKNLLQQKKNMVEQKCSKLQERLKNKAEEVRIYENQTKYVREELLRKAQEWKQQKQMLIEKTHEQERRKAAKEKANCRLDALENKIKTTLKKI